MTSFSPSEASTHGGSRWMDVLRTFLIYRRSILNLCALMAESLDTLVARLRGSLACLIAAVRRQISTSQH